MSVASQVLISAVEKTAPKYLAEDWDNVGLLIGEPGRKINRAMLTLDCTPEVVAEAIRVKAELIIAHHPLIFSPLKQIRFDLPGQDQVATLIQHNIMFYAAHTNLDASPLGGAALLAERMGLREQEFILPGYKDQIFKLAVFVPEERLDAVREAMAKAGAGALGAYSDCFFYGAGTGTFRPQEGSKPYVGQIGRLEQVSEVRLETIVPARNLERVIRAMLKEHPYEMPAYDIIPTNNPGVQFGLGKIGCLPQECTLFELVQSVKAHLGDCPVRVVGNLEQKIKKAAICNGSGGSMVKKAANKGAGALIAGDISHHDALDALAAGMTIIDPGHYATEWLMVENLFHYLNAQMKKEKREVEIFLSSVKTDPFTFI